MGIVYRVEIVRLETLYSLETVFRVGTLYSLDVVTVERRYRVEAGTEWRE